MLHHRDDPLAFVVGRCRNGQAANGQGVPFDRVRREFREFDIGSQRHTYRRAQALALPVPEVQYVTRRGSSPEILFHTCDLHIPALTKSFIYSRNAQGTGNEFPNLGQPEAQNCPRP